MEIMTIESNAYRPPARGRIDREDNRLCGGIPEPGGNGAQTERGSGKPCRQGTESRPEVDDAQGGVRDAGHQPPHPATLPAEAYHSLFHDRAADTLSPAGGREPARAVDGGDTRRQIDRMIAEHPLHNRKNGSYGKKGRDTGKNQ